MEKALIQIGITSLEQLRKRGTKYTFIRILAKDKTAWSSKLCALEGVSQEIRWHNLSANRKEELREFFWMKK